MIVMGGVYAILHQVSLMLYKIGADDQVASVKTQPRRVLVFQFELIGQQLDAPRLAPGSALILNNPG
jgi:hypothetical protein